MDKSIVDFYNGKVNNQIKDYLRGNPRAESAILMAKSFVKKEDKRIIDIGCGIGWSSNEIATTFRESTVLGVDLSPALIKAAKKIFISDNLDFGLRNIIGDSAEEKYNLVLMFDVYEHIPIGDRPVLYEKLNQLLDSRGKIILSCPTVHHQNFLRKNKPDGLQPVDEDVDFQSMIDLSVSLGGEIVYFENKSIWHSNDYFHCVIIRQPTFEKIDNRKDFKGANFKLEKIVERKKRIQEKVPNFNFEKESNRLSLAQRMMQKLKKELNSQ